MTHGRPAMGWVRFQKDNPGATELALGFGTYIFGTNFNGMDRFAIATSLAAAINGSIRLPNTSDVPGQDASPNKEVYAVAMPAQDSAFVLIVAREPGDVGNGITLEIISGGDGVSISGATLSNGSLPVSGATVNQVSHSSAPRTATNNGGDLNNANCSGCFVFIDVTAIAATPSVVFKVQGKDPASGKYFDVIVSAAVVAVSTVVLRIHPALTAVANLTVNDMLPKTFRIRAEHADADSITYSVGVILVP